MTTFRSEALARTCLRVSLLVGLLTVVQACSGAEEVDHSEDEDLVGNFLPPTDEGIAFSVPSHPTGRYRLLRWSRMPNGFIQAVTRQDTQYGSIITKQEVDCSQRSFRITGQGETEEQADRQTQADAGMSGNLVEGSIRDVTISVICQEAQK